MTFKVSKQFLVIIFAISILTSCTKEPVVIEKPNEQQEEMLNAESTMRSLLQADFEVKADATEEASTRKMCFELNFPLEVIYPDKTTANVDSFEALETAFNTWYEENRNSREEPMLNFPVEVTLADGTIESITSEKALLALMKECFENENFVERKCFEFNYPLMVQIEGEEMAITINNLKELESTLRSNDKEVKFDFVFPIRVTLQVGGVKTLETNDDLKALKEHCSKKDKDDDKDEDWDYQADFSTIKNDCFIVDFPVELILPDESKVTVNNEAEFKEVIKAHRIDRDALSEIGFTYPINVILVKDKSFVELTSQDDLKELLASCKKDKGNDDDKDGFLDNWQYHFFDNDCFEVAYPVGLIVDIEKVTINSKEAFFEMVNTYKENNNYKPKFLFNFPINVEFLEDNSVAQINAQDEIRDLFKKCRKDFDGDDDDKDEIDWEEIKEEFDFEFLRNRCFQIQFPVNFSLQDGSLVSADSFDGIFGIIVEEMRTNEGEDFPELNLAYPVTVILKDETKQEINAEEEFDKLIEACEDNRGEEWDWENNDFGFGDFDFEDFDLESIIENFNLSQLDFNSFENFEDFKLFCFEINFPLTININAEERITVEDFGDLIKQIFETVLTNRGQEIEPEVVYPITVTMEEDGTVITINSNDELEELAKSCNN